jgi:branched-chain amino acid transport system substrate-binding protein
MKRRSLLQATGLAGSAAVVPSIAMAQATQGVSKDEIVIGSIQDLSGPIAGFGKQIRFGMQLRVDEVNEQGGINNRKLKVLFEDSKYDPRQAVLLAQKLVNQDRIFAMVGHLGTAQNNAAFPVQSEKNVINFMPVTAAREMYEPFHRLKIAGFSTYFEQMKIAVPRIARERNLRRVGIIHQDDEFGLEVLRGAEAGLKTMNLELVEKTSYKRGATDFSSQVARLRAANCDMVLLGTIIRETIGTIGESRRNGFNPVFLGSSAAYTDLIHRLGGPAMNGLIATMTLQNPYLDDASQPVRFWANKYKTKFNEDPAVFSAYGYVIVDHFISVARKAGNNLTVDSFLKSLDTYSSPADIFGGPPMKFGPTKRLGSDMSRLSVIENGKWKTTSEYFGNA